MKLIPLTQGKFAQVDDKDYAWLMRAGPWHAGRHRNAFYAERHVVVDGKRAKIGMHAAIVGTFQTSKEPDHRDGDGLNNQRANLRRATRAQNNANRRKRRDGHTSIFIGVYALKLRPGRFRACIEIHGKTKHLGSFRSEADAARAYDAAAFAAHGDFAKLNFPRLG